MFLCDTILDKDLKDKLINKMIKNAPYNVALENINKEKDLIEQEKKYYTSIFKRNIYDYCNNFGINLP